MASKQHAEARAEPQPAAAYPEPGRYPREELIARCKELTGWEPEIGRAALQDLDILEQFLTVDEFRQAVAHWLKMIV